MSYKKYAFSECFQDITGGNIKVKKSEYSQSGDIPVVDQGKNKIGGYTSNDFSAKRSGDVIIFGDHTGILKYVNFDFALGADGVKVIQPDYQKVHPKYSYYALGTVHIPDTGYDRKFKYLKRGYIPLPPLPIQERIAEILDAADLLRQKDQALLKKYDELTQSLFLDMFGDPMTNPKGWDILKVADFSNQVTKGESPNWQGYNYTNEGVRFVTSENVRLGYLDISKDKFVAEEFHSKLKRSQLKPNDLLVNLVGASIGRGALVLRELLPANINQAVAKIELCNEIVEPLFILQQIITPQIQERLIGNKVEGARANISLKNVRDLQMLVPPLEIQKIFVEQLNKIKRQIELITHQLEKSENLFQILLQKAFKGDLVNEEHLNLKS